MKQISKVLGMFVAMFLMATSMLAQDDRVTVIKMLNGTQNDNAGTVISEVSEQNGTCLLTVTPAEGNYATAANITAERIVNAGIAQGRLRAPSMDGNAIDVEAIDEANPAGTTTYSFVMPEDENYEVEVTIDFQSRTDISAGTLTLSLPQTGYYYDGEAKKPAVTVTLGNVELASTNYAVSYRDSVNAGQATVVVTGIKTYMGSLTEHFTIAKATLNPTVTLEGWTYNEAPDVISPVVTGNLGQGAVSFTYKAAGQTEFTNTVPQNAGTHTVKASIAETDNYQAAEATSEFTISKADINDDLVQVNLESWTYGDTPNVPSVEGAPDGAQVTYTYLISVDNNVVESETVPTNHGVYGIRANIAESANYNAGTVENEFGIDQADFSDVVIANIANQTYTGEAIQPALVVTYKGNAVNASDYTVEFGNNLNVGQATVTLNTTDVNFFEGQTNPSKTFQIVAASATITAQAQTVTFNGAEQEFTNYEVDNGSVVVNYYASEEERDKGSNALQSAPVDAAVYYVQLTQGNNNFTSEPVNILFTIEQKAINEDMLWNESEGEEFAYNNQPVTLDEGLFGLVYTVDDDIELVEDEDFVVTYSNNDKVGTATVTLEGIGNYKGTVSFNFVIVREMLLSFGIENTNMWATYFAAEDLNTPEELQAYIVTGVSGTTVTVAETTYIPQGVAVLLEKKGEFDALTATAYTGEQGTFNDNLLQGCATATDVTTLNGSDNIYVLYNDEFVKTTKGTIPANRCYLPVAKSSASPARLTIFVENEDTGIAEILNTKNAGNERIYNLNGLRVTNPVKGLYIMNGKKFVVK